MHGFQSFPTDKSKINLSKIKSLKNMYGCDIGYADHSTFEKNDFHELNNSAFILGATYFESIL